MKSEYINCKNCKSRCVWAGKDREPEHKKCFVGYTPITNADRIRAMTDEELAEFMVRTGTEYSCPPPHYFGKNEYCQKHLPDCKKCWLDWLK
jgi:hypothetical protein